VHRGGRRSLRQVAGSRRRYALRRSRRTRRRQVRDHGPDRLALAGRDRAQGTRKGRGGIETPRDGREGRIVAGKRAGEAGGVKALCFLSPFPSGAGDRPCLPDRAAAPAELGWGITAAATLVRLPHTPTLSPEGERE